MAKPAWSRRPKLVWSESRRYSTNDKRRQYSASLAHAHAHRLNVERVDLISDVLPFGCWWYDAINAIGYAMHSSRSHHPVIRVYDATGNAIETQEHKGDFKESRRIPITALPPWEGGFAPFSA